MTVRIRLQSTALAMPVACRCTSWQAIPWGSMLLLAEVQHHCRGASANAPQVQQHQCLPHSYEQRNSLSTGPAARLCKHTLPAVLACCSGRDADICTSSHAWPGSKSNLSRRSAAVCHLHMRTLLFQMPDLLCRRSRARSQYRARR